MTEKNPKHLLSQICVGALLVCVGWAALFERFFETLHKHLRDRSDVLQKNVCNSLFDVVCLTHFLFDKTLSLCVCMLI